MVWEVLAADEALKVVLDFADRDGETLVIFASDHDTGGGVTYGHGPAYSLSSPALDTLARRRTSHHHLVSELLSESPSAGEIQGVVAEHLGFSLQPGQVDQVLDIIGGGARPSHPSAHDSLLHAIGFVLSSIPDGRSDRPAHNYSTGAHTAGVVPTAIYGLGLPRSALGIFDNTELYSWMTGAIGVDHQNPTMTEEEAFRIAGVDAFREVPMM
jgi:alkaline phosphatase